MSAISWLKQNLKILIFYLPHIDTDSFHVKGKTNGIQFIFFETSFIYNIDILKISLIYMNFHYQNQEIIASKKKQKQEVHGSHRSPKEQ